MGQEWRKFTRSSIKTIIHSQGTDSSAQIHDIDLPFDHDIQRFLQDEDAYVNRITQGDLYLWETKEVIKGLKKM